MVFKTFSRARHIINALEAGNPQLAIISYDITAGEEVTFPNWELLSGALQTLITTTLAQEGLAPVD